MRIFKSKWSERYARKEGIADAALEAAIDQAEKGQIDADLGGEVIKQRISRPGQGKSRGYRTIVLFRRVSRPAAVLLLPYLLWVSFASVLTLSMWRLNPGLLG